MFAARSSHSMQWLPLMKPRRIRCSRRTVYLLSKQGGTPTTQSAASSPHSMQQMDGLLVVEARRDTNHTVRSCALQDPLLRLSSFLDGAATMLFEVVHCKLPLMKPRRIRCSRRTVYLLSKQGGTPTTQSAASSPHSMQQMDGLLVVEARRDTNHTVRSCALQDPLLRLSSFLDGAATMLFEVVHCKIIGNKLAASDSTVHLERE